MYRRVFQITVSNVSAVSNLYFSRVCIWHVMWHGNVSRVQNQAMYTLWWMNRKIRYVQSEHKKCSFCMECGINQVHVHMEFSSLCDRICVHYDSHMCAMCDVCNISHDFVIVISIRRRVFDFTVSNVSSVSTLYFSRAKSWHVHRYVTVSCVQNQAMYTLWWMMCEIGYMGNEHEKCSFRTVCAMHCGYPYMMHVRVCALHSIHVCPTWILYMRYAPCMCDIYHDSMNVILMRREVFEITVSSVSNVSIVVAVGLSTDTLADTVTR